MDREAREQYLVVVQVKDMLGLSGGFSSSTTVTVSLTDVNDNGPTFQHREFQWRTRKLRELSLLRFRWVVCAATSLLKLKGGSQKMRAEKEDKEVEKSCSLPNEWI